MPKLTRHSLNQAVIQEHITDFRGRIRSSNYDEEAHYGLGLAYYSLGLLDDSIEELTQAARLMPENPTIQSQLAIVLFDSWEGGNRQLEAQMNSRIQRALLLDPNNHDARILEAELLIRNERFGDTANLLRQLQAPTRDRVRELLTEALEVRCRERITAGDWESAQWCWQSLQPVNELAARSMAVEFLNREKADLPGRIRLGPSRASADAELGRPSVGRTKRVLLSTVSFLGTCVGAMIVFSIVSAWTGTESAADGTTELGVVGGIVAMMAFIAPFLAVWAYWRKSRGIPDPLAASRFRGSSGTVSRDDLLAGSLDTESTFKVASGLIERYRLRAQAEEYKQLVRTGTR